MKKLFGLLVTIAVCLFACDASAQYLTVTTPSNCIKDGSGTNLASGTMLIVGTDANDNAIPYRAGTSIMGTTSTISRIITNGQLATSLQLADPSTTSPLNVLYRFAVQDNFTKRVSLYKQIVISNNDAGNFNFCKMNPLPFMTQVQFGSAPFSFSGDWALLGNLSVAKSTQLCALTTTFSATPTFNASSCNGFKIVLTANVTSSTLSGALTGEPLFIEVCQDATGGRTFVPPTNVLNFATIRTAATACTLQMFWFDGTNAVKDTIITNSTDLAGLVSDKTGTGVLMYNTNPALTSFTQNAGTIFNFFDNTGGVRLSVPSNGTSAGTANNWNIIGGSTLGGTGATAPSIPYNRLAATRGTTLTTAKVGTLTGFGTTATVASVFGTDSSGIINISSSGTGQTGNPTFVLTFADGTWTNPPTVLVCRGDANSPVAAAFFNSSTATTVTLGLQGTPVAGNIYSFVFMTMGR